MWSSRLSVGALPREKDKPWGLALTVTARTGTAVNVTQVTEPVFPLSTPEQMLEFEEGQGKCKQCSTWRTSFLKLIRRIGLCMTFRIL